MMEKFFEWFGRHREPIGYTVGGINLLNGFVGIISGNVVNGIFWILLGSAIIFDTRMFK
jgi:hypothetical protein